MLSDERVMVFGNDGACFVLIAPGLEQKGADFERSRPRTGAQLPYDYSERGSHHDTPSWPLISNVGRGTVNANRRSPKIAAKFLVK